MSCLPSLPLDLLLGGPVVLVQLAVALLQLSGGQVQLLVHLGVLVIHLPQLVHLLSEILEREREREEGRKWLNKTGKRRALVVYADDFTLKRV